MTEVTVLDTGCDDIAGKIASRFEEDGRSTGDTLIRSIRSLNDMTMKKTDILVLSADAAEHEHEQKAHIACDILLLPGELADCDTDMFDAECIVTYGMSPKNTITLSSISENTCVVALQRELVTIKGDILERQEIKVNGGMRPDSLLAVVGTLLLLGQKISDINQ